VFFEFVGTDYSFLCLLTELLEKLLVQFPSEMRIAVPPQRFETFG
jgi:hypothetical protein